MLGLFGQTKQKTVSRDRMRDSEEDEELPRSSNSLTVRRERGWELDSPRSSMKVGLRRERTKSVFRFVSVDHREYRYRD